MSVLDLSVFPGLPARASLKLGVARAILDLIAARGGRGHIPTQRDRKVRRPVDPDLFRERNRIERFFTKLKHFRGIATRCETSACNNLATVLIA